MANRQRAFCFRLDQERDNCTFYFWLTLQYDDDHVPKDHGEMCFSKAHCHKFFEKLRLRYRDSGHTFKHFLVSEYGPNGTHRPHYHCLLMVYNEYNLAQNYEVKREMKDFILSVAWPYGHVTEKGFHGRVLRYLTKYCTKPELIGDYHRMKPFTLISRGIGLSYLDSLSDYQKQQMIEKHDFSVRYGSGKIQLPRYYTDKIFKHDFRTAFRDSSVMRWCQKDIELQYNKQYKRIRAFSEDYEKVLKQDSMHQQAVMQNFKSQINNRKDL